MKLKFIFTAIFSILLGCDVYATSNYDEAVSRYNTVIGMYDDYSSGYAFRAESYLKLGKYLEASDDILKALSIGNDAKALHYLFEFPDGQTTLLVTKLKGMAVQNPHNVEWIGMTYPNKDISTLDFKIFRYYGDPTIDDNGEPEWNYYHWNLYDTVPDRPYIRIRPIHSEEGGLIMTWEFNTYTDL